MLTKLTTAALAFAATALVGTAAYAAQATSSVNVRSGPSTGYRVVDVLSRGEYVDVGECRSNGWCFVSKNGPDGWVSSNYLTNSRGGGVPVYRDRDRDDVDVGFSVRTPGFGFSIRTGDDDRDYRPRRPYRPWYGMRDRDRWDNDYDWRY